MRRLCRTFCFLLIIVLTVTVSGCKNNEDSSEPDVMYNDSNYEFIIEKTGGTTCSNIVMGNGRFACANDFIYFGTTNMLYEYDLLSGKTISYAVRDAVLPRSLFVASDYVCYAEGQLMRQSRDGKHLERVFNSTEEISVLYPEGMKVYYQNFKEGSLFLRDLEANIEETLIDKVLAFYIDEQFIYAITVDEGTPSMSRGLSPSCVTSSQTGRGAELTRSQRPACERLRIQLER